jgi:hypothetical protein
MVLEVREQRQAKSLLVEAQQALQVIAWAGDTKYRYHGHRFMMLLDWARLLLSVAL